MRQKSRRPMKDSQSQKFIDKARELECDEDEAAFEERLRRMSKQKPKKDKDPDQMI